MVRAFLDNDGVSHYTRPSRSTTNLQGGTFCQKVSSDIPDSQLVVVPYISCLGCIAYRESLADAVRRIGQLKNALQTYGWTVVASKDVPEGLV